MPQKIEVTVRPNGSYSSYLAYGSYETKTDDFGDEITTWKRIGYIGKPEEAPQGVKLKRDNNGAKWGNASFEFDYTILVADDFPYWIVEFGTGKQSKGKETVLFEPKNNGSN